MKQIISRAKQSLPDRYQSRPWTYPGLEHGTAILQTEQQLNAYTTAYGEMHQIKCRAAFQNFPFEELSGSIQIVDWGCGQGFGSVCAIRAIEEHKLDQWIKRIMLIEPSRIALNRAVSNINEITNGRVNIVDYNAYCPGNGSNDEIESLDYACENVIHIFSNILDIDSVNLEKLARICATSQRKVFLICISPMNSHSYRVDQFHAIFDNIPCFSCINDYEYSRTTDSYHIVSCKTRCFSYDGRPLHPENVQNIPTPDYFGSQLYTDDYELQQIHFESEATSLSGVLYNDLATQINPQEDFLIVKPNIDGDVIDMMVVRPQKGILIIKLFTHTLKDFIFNSRKDKEGNNVLDKFNLVNQHTGEILISPIVSIGGYQKKILTAKNEELLKLTISDSKTWSLVKKLVVFTKDDTMYARKFFEGNFDYTYIYGRDFESQGNFKAGFLNDVFKYNCKGFSKTIMSSFLRIISPVWHSKKEGRPIRLNTAQARLAKSEAGKSQKISGVAGSGKTLVLATRCVNAQKRTGGDVLVLTYNKTLANYVEHRINEIYEDFPWNKIHISHYHKFFRQHAHTCDKHVYLSSYEDCDFFDNEWERNNFLKYDAIFVDEVQDYKTEWLQILQNVFLKENGEFVVFGDPKQNVYNNALDSKGDIKLGVIPGLWNHELQESKRYHNLQLLKLFNSFQQKFYSKPELADLSTLSGNESIFTCIEYKNLGELPDIGPLFNYIEEIRHKYELNDSDLSILAHGNDILRELTDKIVHSTDSKVSTTFCTEDDLAELRNKNYKYKNQFLSDIESIDQIKKYHFNIDTPGIKISTIDSFKGWESPVVILIIQNEGVTGHKYTVPYRMMTPELVYTGITRASESLFIINLGNKVYDDFFKQQQL